MAIVKSKILNQLSKNYPNFLKKDLEKFTDIILKEIKNTLKRGERVELRGFGIFPLKYKKLEYLEILKLVKKLILQQKKLLTLKCQKKCLIN